MHRILIVPAAGLGSRLKADRPKALVPVAGRPMIDHLIERCRPFVDSIVIVAHPSFSAAIGKHLDTTRGSGLLYGVVEQPAPTGMLDAILAAAPIIGAMQADSVWIIWCDQVGILPDTLLRLAEASAVSPPPALVFPTVSGPEPYIHYPRDGSGRIAGVLQRREGDVMPREGESDMGVFALSNEAYSEALPRFAAETTPGPGTGERNFLPFIPWLAARATVVTIPCTDPAEALGINTPDQLRAVEAWLSERAGRP